MCEVRHRSPRRCIERRTRVAKRGPKLRRKERRCGNSRFYRKAGRRSAIAGGLFSFEVEDKGSSTTESLNTPAWCRVPELHARSAPWFFGSPAVRLKPHPFESVG